MIGIISDIHGNYIALKKVLDALDEMEVKEVYCLGDVVGYYSQVNEVCDELRKRNIECVMGNHDWYMAARSFCTRSKSVNDCLRFQRSVISETNFSWISTFPFYRDVGTIRMVHGGWSNPIDEYLELSEDYFNNVEGNVFVSGHSHVQTIKQFGEKTYCNPGSVGQPRDGDPRAGFATWDGKSFTLHRVTYDIEAVGKLMELAGFNGYYYGCLRTGAKNLCY